MIKQRNRRMKRTERLFLDRISVKRMAAVSRQQQRRNGLGGAWYAPEGRHWSCGESEG